MLGHTGATSDESFTYFERWQRPLTVNQSHENPVEIDEPVDKTDNVKNLDLR